MEGKMVARYEVKLTEKKKQNWKVTLENVKHALTAILDAAM